MSKRALKYVNYFPIDHYCNFPALMLDSKLRRNMFWKNTNIKFKIVILLLLLVQDC